MLKRTLWRPTKHNERVLGVGQLCRDVDGVADAASYRAVVGVGAVGALHFGAVFVGLDAAQRVGGVDSFDDEDLAVLLDLADRL